MIRGGVALILAMFLGCAPRPTTTLPWHDFRIGDLRGGFARPAMVLFTSSECWFCDQMAGRTFPHPSVLSLGRHFTLIRVDLSAKKTAAVRRWLIHSFRIRRTPTVIFLDRRGREMQWLRLAGFAWPDTLSRHMKAALAATGESER